MSRENVEFVQRAIGAWNTGDLEAWVRLYPTDLKFHDAADVPDGRVHSGREAVVARLREAVDALGQFQIEVDEVIDVGDHVVAVCRFHVQGQQSGVALDTPWIQVVDFRNGLPVSIRNFQDRTQALEAVGLRE